MIKKTHNPINKNNTMSLNQLLTPVRPLSVSLQSVAISAGGAITMGTGSSITLPSGDNLRISDTLTGPWLTPQNCVVRLLKMPGNAILFTLAMSAAEANLPTFIALTTPLPVGFRPSVTTTYIPVPVISNAVYSVGICQISTTGIVNIFTSVCGPFPGLGVTGTASVVECVFRAAADP